MHDQYMCPKATDMYSLRTVGESDQDLFDVLSWGTGAIVGHSYDMHPQRDMKIDEQGDC